MTTTNQKPWIEQDEVENNQIRHQQNGDLFDEDVTSGNLKNSRHSIGDYNLDNDEDDENLSDDDVKGRDLDTDNTDEWDEDNLNETDLDEDDLHDDDETLADIHAVKNDQFGSLASSLQTGPESVTAESLSGFANSASLPVNESVEPEPDEIPEEHEADDDELDYPDDDRMEQAPDDEVSYKEKNEVEKPDEPEAPKEATLDNLDPNFTENNHGRTTGRMIDHEPGSGSTMGDHGAYNL